MERVILNRSACCQKKQIQMLAYNITGKILINEDAMTMCLYLCLLYILWIDIILKTSIISFGLFWLFTNLLPWSLLLFVNNSIRIILILSTYQELKLVVMAIRCQCRE